MNDDVSRPETALIVRPQVLPSLAQFEIERQLAGRLFKARGFLPSHYFLGPEDERFAKVLAAIEYGRAVGIEPMIALQNLTNIDGKIGASAMLIGAQLKKSGYTWRTSWFDQQGATVPKESPTVWGCKVVILKEGEETGDGAFSLTDAQRAGLIKERSNWAHYPKDMLFARALTQGARQGAPDAVLGMAYTAEELGADVDVDGQVVTLPPPPGGIIDAAWSDPDQPGAPAVTSAPPAAPVEVTPVPASAGADEQAVGAAVSGEGAPSTPAPPEPQPDPAQTPPPPLTSMTPLSGAAVNRRMGRSIGPAPKRTNTVTIQPQAATAPAAAVEEGPAPAPQPEPVSSQPAPAGLTDEPVAAPEPPVVDEGELKYRADMRQELRKAAAALTRTNRIYSNKLVHAPKGEEPEPVTPAEPNPDSDEALRLFIERDFPGRTLANLGTAELQNRLELVEASLAKKRAVMAERGVTEE